MVEAVAHLIPVRQHLLAEVEVEVVLIPVMAQQVLVILHQPRQAKATVEELELFQLLVVVVAVAGQTHLVKLLLLMAVETVVLVQRQA
jgi:hypothetical protein